MALSFKSPDVAKAYGMLDENLRRATEDSPHPITVTSAFRNPALNRAVGGKPNSHHQHGRAIDIRTRGLDKASLDGIMNHYRNVGYNPILESDHLHVQPGGHMPAVPQKNQDLIKKGMGLAQNVSDQDIASATAMPPAKKTKGMGLETGLAMGAGALSAIASLLGKGPDHGITPISGGGGGSASILGGQSYNAGPLQRQGALGGDPYRSEAILALLGKK